MSTAVRLQENKEFPEFINSAVRGLLRGLRIDQPEIFNQLYDSYGFPTEEGYSFEDRMKMAMYIELIKAGIIKS